MSGPRDGLPPEFDPRRGQPPRPPRGRSPGGRSGGGYPDGSGSGSRGDGGSAGYRGGRGQDPRGGHPGSRRGGQLPPELDPRGSYRPDGLGGYDVPAAGRAAGRPPRGRHSPLVAALRVTAAFLSVLVLVASGVMWFLYRDFSTKVDRVNAIGATHDDVDGRDTNILLVGSDDRTNATRRSSRSCPPPSRSPTRPTR